MVAKNSKVDFRSYVSLVPFSKFAHASKFGVDCWKLITLTYDFNVGPRPRVSSRDFGHYIIGQRTRSMTTRAPRGPHAPSRIRSDDMIYDIYDKMMTYMIYDMDKVPASGWVNWAGSSLVKNNQ